MALVKCESCGREISDQAMACPTCGHPMKATTIEATAKKWKLAVVAGTIAAALGFIFLLAGMTGHSGSSSTSLGAGLFVVGFIALAIGKLGKWWYHE